MPDICNEISLVLDSMFNSELPSRQHLPALIYKLADGRKTALSLPWRSREVLLSRPTHMAAANSEGRITHQSVKEATNVQGGKQCHHMHLETCRKGYHGRVGCRLCMKAGKCPKTGCVLLQEMTQEEMEAFAHSKNAPCWCKIPEDAFLPDETDKDLNDEINTQDNDEYYSDGDIDSIATAPSIATEPMEDDESIPDKFFCENENKTVGIAFQAIRDIPPDLTPATYSIIDVLQKSKRPPLIVWETARRSPQKILDDHNADGSPLTKDQIIQQLKRNLDTVHEFSEDHPLWERLDDLSPGCLQDFYTKLVDSFQTANQYVASYNPPLSFCTGSHNNAVLLGGDQQAKAATFYLCPYMGKLKFPLQDCLVILQKALDHVSVHKSVAEDSGTDNRTSKHILQRCLMKLNLQMELSGKLPCAYQLCSMILH